MEPRASRGRASGSSAAAGFVLLLGALTQLGCSPVRPEQRAVLADKIMRFGADARARSALEHALENREGSIGGGSVRGGGCGCN